MSEHPIEGLMTTAMQSIKEMVDVNTIVGDAVQAPDGTVIIPISKVCFGFAAGGGDYGQQAGSSEEGPGKLPFAGGSGAGVSINPVAFMVCGENQVKLLPVDINTSIDKVLDLIPGVVDKINDILCSRHSDKKDNGGCNKKKKKEDKEDKEDEEA
ncbi:sporulation protein YtfJ [Ruminiclostridium sufflavum DSM 19573]|uniref:Sporulation protein YtfJ n=1 Tax=Ruminiclostridium sufflavum DSM 19573 TaxID=1121337 RepID=A0A318XM12_9FIRM|nr:GerW family sporulation protein [Ruminiclostridium sufflavum]PYG87588.1 sporulation protein YtfJ [Ruminiclostridium sufflavum DSM 19573]